MSTQLTVKTQVPEILSVIEEKLKSIKKINETPYKTTGNLEIFGDITKELKIENLIRAYSMVASKESSYNQASKDLDLNEVPAFTVSGGTKEDWKHDIKLSIAIVQQDTQLKKLTEYKDKMSKFLSEEDQKSMLLKEMAEFLKEN